MIAAPALSTLPARAAGPDTAVRCARTPEAAALQAAPASTGGALPGDALPGDAQRGFRLVGLHSDALRGRAWALVGRCGDAAKPLVAVPLADGRIAGGPPAGAPLNGSLPEAMRSEAGGPVRPVAPGLPMPAPPVVRAGDRLRVVSASAESQMELEGWAEEPGPSGAVVRVRLPRLGSDGGEAPRVLRCRVVETGLVEVLP